MRLAVPFPFSLSFLSRDSYRFSLLLRPSVQAVAAGEILSGSLKLHPIDLLYKMAPKAALQCLILACLTGEVTSIASRWATELSPSVSLWPTFGVVSTGVMSFSLNISSLVSNKLTSALTLCIAANVKQVLMILLATVIFDIPVSVLNGSGIGVVLIGSAYYSWVSMQEKTGGGGGTKAAPAKVEKDNDEGVSLINNKE